MSARAQDPDPTQEFPDVESSFAAGLLSQELQSSNPGIALDGEKNFADEILRKLSDTGQEERSKRYLMGDEIGRGGMGVVHKVLDTDLRRTLAMKVALSQEHGDETRASFVSRFLEEAQVTGQLDHPGIVPLHEVGMDSRGRIYFTMRMVKGKHLGEIFALARKGQEGWTTPKALIALIRVCEAMAYAHSKGVVHRDLKPANVMAGEFGEVYVMDWGLCKVRGRTEHEAERLRKIANHSLSLVKTDRVEREGLATEYGSTLGTPAYMSPEQGKGAWEQVDNRSDIYSVGAMIYELITGRAPYLPEGGRIPPHTVLQWLLERAPRPPRELAPKAPVELCAICERAMAREPEQRYRDMLELADDLRQYLTGRPLRALKLNALQRCARWVRRNPVISAFIVAAILGSSVAMASLARLPERLVRAAAEDDTRSKAKLLQDVNVLYSKNVVDRVRGHVVITHDYKAEEGAIPLPATFLIELGAKISADSGNDGLQVRQYSDYPFRFRGPAKLDEFGTQALASLRANPGQPFVRYEDVDGRPSLRYAEARIMAEACVKCHNEDPESTKRDWKVGDVRGVLEIIHPLDRDEARMRSGLLASFGWAGGIFLALLGFAAILLLRAERQRRHAGL